MAALKTLTVDDISGISQLDFLISEVNKLISLPEIYYRLEAAIESPSSTIADFASLLGSDPDLCARLLSMANSAFYSFPAKIETIERAVSTIGLRQIRELVLATSIMKMFNKVPLGMVNMSSFWEHSVAVGVFAKSLAQHAGLPQSERYYVPGLLHDIGRLVMYLKAPDVMHALLPQSESQTQNLYILEQELLSYTHAEIGGRLLELWKIPQSIYEPVGFHHKPELSAEFATMTCAVHIADAWANKYKIGSSGERLIPSIQSEATRVLGIEVGELDEIWVLAIDDINDVIRQFVTH
ncbi:MAG: HD-like signal output (HDOD) protein [Gammaproteobacteria bacterium]|jgi:HD-like signal output (HDOD) protein